MHSQSRLAVETRSRISTLATESRPISIGEEKSSKVSPQLSLEALYVYIHAYMYDTIGDFLVFTSIDTSLVSSYIRYTVSAST